MGLFSFPDIPSLPGVPSLPRFPTSLTQVANLAGSIMGQNLNVTSIAGQLFKGSVLSGHGMIDGTSILNQLSGTGGGVGSYLVSAAQTFSGSLTSLFTPPSFDDILGVDRDDPSVSSATSSSSQWGIFDSGGNAVITADSVYSVEYSKDFRISDYPVAPNSFASYNKVETPYDFKIIFTQGGTVQDRQDLLDAVADLVTSLDLYDAVTPEATYTGANPVHYDYSRSAQRGATLLRVAIYFEQVRETASQSFTQTDSGTSSPVDKITSPSDPTATSLFDSGPIQALAPTAAQQAIVLPQSAITKAFSQAFQ